MNFRTNSQDSHWDKKGTTDTWPEKTKQWRLPRFMLFTATHYWLVGSGFEPRRGAIPGLGPTKPPVQSHLGSFPGLRWPKCDLSHSCTRHSLPSEAEIYEAPCFINVFARIPTNIRPEPDESHFKLHFNIIVPYMFQKWSCPFRSSN